MYFSRREILGGFGACIGMVVVSPVTWAVQKAFPDIKLKIRNTLSHKGVLSVAWNPTGDLIASAGGHYALWNPWTGKKIHELKAPWAAFVPGAPVRFTADGRYVVVASDSAKIGDAMVGFGLWNVETGDLERQIPVPEEYFPLGKGGKPWFAAIPNRQQAVVMYINHPGWPILIYDTTTWEVARVLLRIPQSGVNCLDVSPDGRLLAIGGSKLGPLTGEPKGRIDLYDLDSGTLLRRIEGAHKDSVHHLAFSSDGSLLASGPWEIGSRALNQTTNKLESMQDPDPVRVWDVHTGKMKISFSGVFPGVSNLSFHPSRPWLSGSLGTIIGKTDDPEFRVWDCDVGETVLSYKHFSASAEYITFSPDGRFLAISGNSKWFFSTSGVQIAEIIPTGMRAE